MRPGGQQGTQVDGQGLGERGRGDAAAEGVELLEGDAGIERGVRSGDVQLIRDIADELLRWGRLEGWAVAGLSAVG